ncbi:hypothetical protein BDV96DRAFT_541047 [Lophiotrema nucula]|uniref:DUF336-domain-containing protein n=1 Tax=Lophiotrema nucula TaxID=690887 RepID=A0A6A5ZGZ9_9PLEO|nr:hypothetical protein BDV96DRAFT_541047 [Lophiotrema nucula]
MPGRPTAATVTVSQPTLTLSGARIALAAAEQHAKTISTPMNIAIVDSHCHLLAFHRMDGAKITSINIALDKAFTAAGHRVPTSTYRENVWPGGPAFGLGNTNGGRFCTIGGGVPILDEEGKVLGAIGCSTGTPAQDEAVANAGKNAVLELIRAEKEKVIEEEKVEERKTAKRRRINGTHKPLESTIVEKITA